MRLAGHVALKGEERNAYRSLVWNPEGRRSLGKPRCRWVVNIRMDLGEVGWGGVDWISLTQDRDKRRARVNVVLNLRAWLNAWLKCRVATQLVASRVVPKSIELFGLLAG
jgi:hypothetical protein